MATLTELRQAVQNLLQMPGFTIALQLNSNTRERAFEAYVFALIVRAMRQAGAAVEIHGINTGLNPNPLVFRGGPGQMSSTAQNFCFARCYLNDLELEIHLDVKYSGSSNATHEVDISIYDKFKADAVRQSTALPSTRSLHGAIECKFYDSSLGIDLGRGFYGLIADCGTLRVKCFATNGNDTGLAKYFHPTTRPNVFFDMSPLRSGIEDRFVANVEQILREWAGVT